MNADLRHIEGLVFDLDGTLIQSTIDFVQMKRRIFERMFKAGVTNECLDGSKSISYNLNASARILAEEGNDKAARTLYSEADKIMGEIEMQKVSETKAFPGTVKAIALLVDQGYPVAVLTRGSRQYTESALAASGLASYFINSVCRDDHPDDEAKPNPISMARAAGKMGVKREACLLVGDHEMDWECALSAGSGFIGVLSGATDQNTWTKLGSVTVIPDVSFLPDLLVRR